LARTGPEHSFTEPKPDCGISTGVAKKAVMDWMNRNHKKHLEAIIGLKQAKGFIPEPSDRRMKDLLKLWETPTAIQTTRLLPSAAVIQTARLLRSQSYRQANSLVNRHRVASAGSFYTLQFATRLPELQYRR
jgi:hypothetical protein